jgi:hypothetical protein
VLIFAMVRVPASNAEFLAVVVGAIAFASGLAGYLRLSPISICFIAGVLVTNFPNDERESIFRILHHLERPVHLLFLMIAGALWDVTDWRGWLLVPLFVAGTKTTAALVEVHPNEEAAWYWIRFLGIYDAAFLVLSLWVFEALVIE